MDYVERLDQRDPTLKDIYLDNKNYRNEHVVAVVDALLRNPDVAQYVHVCHNRLTDEIGMKLALLLAVSKTLCWLDLSWNNFTDDTFEAVAAALRVNTSLIYLNMSMNDEKDEETIDGVFADALRVNPRVWQYSGWTLYMQGRRDFDRLMKIATAEQ